MFVITRPINGITLNGREFLLTEQGLTKEFESVSEAELFLAVHGLSDQEAYGINIEAR